MTITNHVPTPLGIKGLGSIAVAILGSGLAISQSPDWPLALLISAFIVLGVAFAYWVMKHNEHQDSRIAELTEKDKACQKALQAGRDALQKRDMLISLLYHSSDTDGKKLRKIGRRSSDKMIFDLIMGDEAKPAKDALHQLVERIVAKGSIPQ